MSCPFCVRISFDRKQVVMLFKKNVLTHEGHVVNEVYTYGHARFESDLSVDEKNQLAKLGRIGSTAQNVENGFIRLLMNRTYESDMIHRVIKKHRTLQFGGSSECMIRLMDLGNYNKSKGGIFEMTSDNGGRLETLHWYSPFSK